MLKSYNKTEAKLYEELLEKSDEELRRKIINQYREIKALKAECKTWKHIAET